MIENNCLVITCTSDIDPYYQLFGTDITALGDGKLPFVAGDTLTLAFDSVVPSGAGASIKYFQYVNGVWKNSEVKLAESSSFARFTSNFKIDKTATGFMIRFVVSPALACIKVKNIVLTKGNVSPNYFPSVADAIRPINENLPFKAITDDLNALLTKKEE